jgi:circadian clock protein KaiC
MDAWLLVRVQESDGERNRLLYILKSRGMAHSNQVREFRLTDDGIHLLDVYVGPGKVLTGSARLAQEARDKAQSVTNRHAAERRRRELQAERAALTEQVESLGVRLRNVQEELKIAHLHDRLRQEAAFKERQDLSTARRADRTR